jgi:hypothetical protein
VLAVPLLLANLQLGSPAPAHGAVTVANSDTTGPVSRFDVDGNALDAHDGSILQAGNTFYLYGTPG